jgi:hypothetical protein
MIGRAISMTEVEDALRMAVDRKPKLADRYANEQVPNNPLLRHLLAIEETFQKRAQEQLKRDLHNMCPENSFFSVARGLERLRSLRRGISSRARSERDSSTESDRPLKRRGTA